MGLLEKLLKGHGGRKERTDANVESKYKEALKNLVYDDELVTELLPVFTKLHGTEGFSKVVELLETKEKQIASISGDEWFEQKHDESENDKSTDNQEQDSDEESLSAEQILENKYKVTE